MIIFREENESWDNPIYGVFGIEHCMTGARKLLAMLMKMRLSVRFGYLAGHMIERGA
jgi:hypothetical protein